MITDFTVTRDSNVVSAKVRQSFVANRRAYMDAISLGLVSEMGRADDERVRIRVGNDQMGQRVDLDLVTGQWHVLPARPKFVAVSGYGGVKGLLQSLVDNAIRGT